MKNLKAYLKPFLFISFFSWSCSKNDQQAANFSYSTDQSVGYSAHDLLSADKFSSLKVEIQYMSGFQPDQTAINNLSSFLNSRLNKPGQIQIVQEEISATADTAYTIDEVVTEENNNRTTFSKSGQLGVYFLFTDNVYSGGGNTLGVSYRNSSMVLFGGTIFKNSGGLGQISRATLETTVMEHEFGHILGLVDIGSPMQTNHIDPAHGNHCNNSNCLMYYEVETTSMIGMFGSNIPSLDANCLADLKANGGK
jgi:hypothetical protein